MTGILGLISAGALVAGGDFLLGTDGPDHLIGADESLIMGYGGNDTLRGGNGSPWIDGGPGDDSIWGGTHGGTIHGGPGQDHLFPRGGSGDHNTVYVGGDGETDVVSAYGNGCADTIYAGPEDVVTISPSEGDVVIKWEPATGGGACGARGE